MRVLLCEHINIDKIAQNKWDNILLDFDDVHLHHREEAQDSKDLEQVLNVERLQYLPLFLF